MFIYILIIKMKVLLLYLDEIKTTSSHASDVLPPTFTDIFYKGNDEYSGKCSETITFAFNEGEYITHYEFIFGDMPLGTLNSWEIAGTDTSSTKIFLHKVENYKFEPNKKYKFSIQNPNMFRNIILIIKSCDNSVFSIKKINYISSSITTDCESDGIWYRQASNYEVFYLCSSLLLNYNGYAKRKCENTVWSSIDYSECNICNEQKLYIKKSYDNKENCLKENFKIVNGDTELYNNNNIHCDSNNNTIKYFCINNNVKPYVDLMYIILILDIIKYGIMDQN